MSLKDELYKFYWEDRLTQKEIGKRYNKSRSWVKEIINKYNILTRRNVDIKTRFLFYIKLPENVNDCWEWVGYKDKSGYGQFNLNKKKMLAHRVSYILFIGEFDQTLCCIHKCDNPGCVNPDHLFLGTQKDNMEDMKQKDRGAKGEQLPQSKLTEKEIKEIKEIKTLLLQGVSQVKIGILFKVTHYTINRIKQGRTWKHIGGE